MATETPEKQGEKSVSDLLELQSEAFREHTELHQKSIAELQAATAELKESRELLEDLVGEMDRLTQRISTQLKAFILATEKVDPPPEESEKE